MLSCFTTVSVSMFCAGSQVPTIYTINIYPPIDWVPSRTPRQWAHAQAVRRQFVCNTLQVGRQRLSSGKWRMPGPLKGVWMFNKYSREKLKTPEGRECCGSRPGRLFEHCCETHLPLYYFLKERKLACSIAFELPPTHLRIKFCSRELLSLVRCYSFPCTSTHACTATHTPKLNSCILNPAEQKIKNLVNLHRRNASNFKDST